jgi:hypothetical protein
MPGGIEIKLTTEVEEIGIADYTIASGTFNMKFEAILPPDAAPPRSSEFAFNMLISYPWFFNHCKWTFPRNVAPLHYEPQATIYAFVYWGDL